MDFLSCLKEKILVLDGATGTAIQNYNLDEKDFLGKKGCNEILNLTRRDVIKEIHKKYIEAGADIIETNSFNCNRVSLEDYQIEDKVYELTLESVKIAKEAINESKSKRKIFIAGSVGPTSKSLSVPVGEDPYDRAIEFDELKEIYKEQVSGLIDGGVDLLLIETIFDGLNAKAAIIGAEEVMEEKGKNLPIMVSVTVNKQGKIFTGQSIEALILALDRNSIISYGFNCSFGAKELIPLTKKLGKFIKKPISLYPNAGLPNQDGEYDETPDITVGYLKELVDNEEINILGGCCGTHYGHIEKIAQLVRGKKPRKFDMNFKLNGKFSGNEIYEFTGKFTKIGERNNVSGSKIFRNLIQEKNYIKALEIARAQIERGATIIDINMDDALLNSKDEMKKYLRVIQNDRVVSKVPIMVDSSDFEVIEEALKNIQGKCIVNSISLKEGEAEFIRKAEFIKKYGGAVVVMAFDERGQGVSYERKREICNRSYQILKKIGYIDTDIIFDPNILTVGTGSDDDRYNAINFLKACEWIRENLGEVGVTGGLSNLSFAFRGNNILRAGIHSIFLKEAIAKGMNFAIMNPAESTPDLTIEQRTTIEELLRGEESGLDKILALNFENKKVVLKEEKKYENVDERLKKALILGGSTTLEEDVKEALERYEPLFIIQNILMDGMKTIGELFERGEMYLPQLIRSAAVMNSAVNIITPYLKIEDNIETKGTVVMATVEGDVHDIGKNIVGTVLKCNGYNVIDIGVMASKEKILESAINNKADVVTLSGLITPSLKEMEKVLELFEKEKLSIPVFIAGAATSPLHTALKLEPVYKGKTLHVTEAVDTLSAVKYICSARKEEFLKEKSEYLEKLRKLYNEREVKEQIIDRNDYSSQTIVPKIIGKEYFEVPISELENGIDWDIFFSNLKIKEIGEKKKVLSEANEILNELKNKGVVLKASYGIFPCTKIGNILKVENKEFKFFNEKNILKFLNEEDFIGAFAVSIYSNIYEKDCYKNILEQLLLIRLVESGAEFLQKYVSEKNWKIKIRPAIGYPLLSDHSLKEPVLELVDGKKLGIELTNNYAMKPLSSVCGLYLANPKSFY